MTLQPIDRWADQGPEFNRPVAEAIYSTMMKMHPDEAVMFSRMVGDAVLEDDLLVHGELIAKALYEEQTERALALRAQLARTAVVKARAGQSADTELAAIHEISKSFVGDLFNSDKRSERARKQQRGVGTGRFVRETNDVIHERNTPLSASEVGRLKIAPEPTDWSAITPAERAAYQQAYQQVSSMIEPYRRLPSGSAFVHLLDSNGAGMDNLIPINGAKALDAAAFDPRDGRKIHQMKVSVIPPEDEQGAYFSLFDRLGLPRFGSVAAGATDNGALDPKRLNAFATKVHERREGDEHRPSRKVLRRVHASSELIQNTLGNVTPPQAQIALKTAQHVATLGPAVQNVVGPTMDRAAYRYRGTERAPAPELLNAVDADTRTAARKVRLGEDSTRQVTESEAMRDQRLRRSAATAEEQSAAIRQRWQQAGQDRQAGLLDRGALKEQTRAAQRDLASVASRRATADKLANAAHEQVVGGHAARLKAAQADHAKMTAQILARGYAGDDDQWKSGEVLAYFKSRVPTPELSDLHLKAGTVPPSEGVIIDRNGKVTAQTVGYGEDHYLPFTLRGLRKLRGGSYIRTRTWGGPTPEDIRASLLGGAKRLTVVSNNGVFNVEFDPEFRGGRRHNDKAHRMIGRYEHLLDAVKSESVSQGNIDPAKYAELEDRAAQRFSDRTSVGYQSALKGLVDDYRKKPTMSKPQLDAAAEDYMSELADRLGVEGSQPETGAGLHARGARAPRLSASERLMDVVATRTATSRRDALKASYEKWNRENPEKAFPPSSQTLPSVEVVRQEVLDSLRSSDPQVQAANIAGALQQGPQFTAHMQRAQDQFATSMRKLRLDGPGYGAALKALKQQFPYYITSTTFEPWADRPQSTDSGYVRPGSLRPGQAMAGLFDSPDGNTTVAANTIRGQFSAKPAAEKEAAAATEAEAAPAKEVNVAKLRERADRDMLSALLAQRNFGPNAAIPDGGATFGGADIRLTAVEQQNFPPEMAVFFGPDVDEAALHDALLAEPDKMRPKMAKAVAWMEAHKAFPTDPAHEAVVSNFKTGGRASSVSSETNPERLLDAPDRDYSFTHALGDAYVPGGGTSSGDIANAYLTDEQISPHVAVKLLPPTIDDPDFAAKAATLRRTLKAQDDAIADWEAEGEGMGGPPVSPERHEQNVRGLIQAMTLRRNYARAKSSEDAASAAAGAERQQEFEREQALAPQLMFPGWGPKEFAAMADDPEMAAKAQEGMAMMQRLAERGQQEDQDVRDLNALNRAQGKA